jgi:hypothetical protein
MGSGHPGRDETVFSSSAFEGRAMITSNFGEVPEPDPALGAQRSYPPFVRKRRVRVLRGRFCFDFGLAISCGGSFELKRGEKKKLTIAPSYGGASLGDFETERTIDSAVKYQVGECDSIAPVLCYSESEAHLYECIANLGVRRWIYKSTEFFPRGRAELHMNRWKNDPECGCVGGDAEGGDADGGDVVESLLDLASAAKVSKVITTMNFDRNPEYGETIDPNEVVVAAASVFAEALVPAILPNDLDANATSPDQMNIDSGVMNVDGSITWFVSSTSSPEERLTLPLSVVSIDCGAYLRRGLIVRDRENPMPFLAFAPTSQAAGATTTIYARLPGEDELQMIEVQQAVTHVDWFTTVWAEVKLNELPDESEGFVEVELFDEAGRPIGLPTRIAFRSEETPAVSALPRLSVLQ